MKYLLIIFLLVGCKDQHPYVIQNMMGEWVVKQNNAYLSQIRSEMMLYNYVRICGPEISPYDTVMEEKDQEHDAISETVIFYKTKGAADSALNRLNEKLIASEAAKAANRQTLARRRKTEDSINNLKYTFK